MMPRIPANLNTPFFHLLTVEELQARVDLWRWVLLHAKAPAASRAAEAQLRRSSDWLLFRTAYAEWRAKHRASVVFGRRVHAPSIVAGMPRRKVLEAA